MVTGYYHFQRNARNTQVTLNEFPPPSVAPAPGTQIRVRPGSPTLFRNRFPNVNLTVAGVEEVGGGGRVEELIN